MPARLVHLPKENSYDAITQRVARLSKERDVLVLTAREPSATLRSRYEAAGADMARIYTLDAITSPLDAQSTDQAHFVGNPAMLELITRRAYVMMRRIAKGHVTAIADCVASFARHSPPEALVGILQITFSTAMNEFTDIEYMVPPGFEDERAYAMIRGQFEQHPHLAPDGTLT